MDLKYQLYDSLEIKSASKRNGFGQERGFNHLSIKVSEPIAEQTPVSLFKYDDFSPMVDTFVNPSSVVIPSDNQFPSPTPTPTFSKFIKTQCQHPLSQAANQSDINVMADLSTTTTPTNLQLPAFSSWPYASPISPNFSTAFNDIYFNNSMINTPNRLVMSPLYTSMPLPTTLTYSLDSDLGKIDPNTPIHHENFASDLTNNVTPPFLLQDPGLVNGSPSPQIVPDQHSPTFSAALMSPSTETSPNILFVPWEVGLLDPQSGIIDFSIPQTRKFEMPNLSDKPPGSTEPSYEENPKFTSLTSPTIDSFQSSISGNNDATQMYTCTYPNCKKMFSCIYNLRSHYRIHSTERPFKCDSCRQSFSRNHDLKRHQKIHLGIKPYRCTKCDRTFGRLDALKRHTLVKRCAEKANKEKPRLAYPVTNQISNTTATSTHTNSEQTD